ncbi:flagellar basal body protein [Virgifigura deserti]|uniref:flagellar basal body protein n=1 Tax=Virgifigura deserti TaxID=2268457 RepID=UPI003CCBE267
MDVMGIGLFKLASSRLSYLATRHQTIAENVSNASTPGFVSRDLKPFEAALKEAEVRLARTQPGHMGLGSAAEDGRFGVDSDAPVWEVTPSGNSVVLEQEMLKASETVASYSLVSNLYKSSHSMLKLAISSQ